MRLEVEERQGKRSWGDRELRMLRYRILVLLGLAVASIGIH